MRFRTWVPEYHSPACILRGAGGEPQALPADICMLRAFRWRRGAIETDGSSKCG